MLKKFLSVALVLCMVLSLLPATSVHAEEYVYSEDGYIYNWGVRGETATSLSANAEKFYTDTPYEALSAYAGGTGTSDAPNSALYGALQALMKNAHHYETSYGDTRYLFCYTDCQNSAKTSATISSFYSGKAVGPEWDGGGTWNREHTWPNSKGDASGNGENDLMMLRPAAVSENSSRGNKAYGESSGFYYPNTESDGAYDLRGDVSRIMLYVYVRWGNTVSMWGSEGVIESLDILLKWMAEDPVDTWELGRNDSVQSITGTRNVFVDYPELAFLLFGAEIPADLVSPTSGNVPSGHTHSYATVVTAPTCTAEGYTTYTCECGYSYKGEYTDMVAHTYVDGTCSICGEAEASGNVATLVTDVSSLQVGDKIIIVANAYDNALSTNQKTNNRGAAAVTRNGNTLTYGDDTQIIVLENGNLDGTFAFNVGNGYLYAGSSSKNYLKTETALSNNSSWSITIDSAGVATIKAQGTNTRNWMRYNLNNGSPLFSCYASGQENISIYVLASSFCNHNYEVEKIVEPTCTVGGYSVYTCTLCGDSYNADETAPDGHHYENGACTVCGTAESTGPKVDKAYKFGMIQENVSTTDVYYLTGAMSGYYMATTTDVNAAIDVYLETTDGGYYLYTYVDDVKTYINMVVSGNYVNGAYESNASTVYTWDESSNTVVATVNGTLYWFGTRNDKTYTTVGPVKTSYNGFYCRFYDVSVDSDPCANGHTYESVVTAPTCVQGGYTTFTCSVCGDSYVGDETMPTGEHDYVDGVCSVCGAEKIAASEGLEYTLSDDGTYYIVTGIGTCTDTDIVIPSTYNGLPVAEIGNRAFIDCDSLTGVTIPDSVTSIGYSAFYTCYYLESIIIPDSVTSIGDSAFCGCIRMTSVTIGDGVTSIGEDAFWGCASLTSVTIGNGVTSIGDEAFSRCDSLTSITIPDSVTSIGYQAFYYCSSLTSVTIGDDVTGTGDGVTSIGDYAFYYCDNLVSVAIGDGVASIGYGAFSSCSSLASVTIGQGVTSIGERVFYSCASLTGIWVDSDNSAYSSDERGVLYSKDKTQLVAVPGALSGEYTILDGVTGIGDYAFYLCGKLESITIPDSVTAIGEYAFSDCGSLASVTIGDGVTSIGERAFAYCSSLESIAIQDGVTGIGDYAFYWCGKLESITIPDSVTAIGEYAFSDCDSLTSVTIEDGVISIGDSAFSGCDNLESITIPDSVTSIGNLAFSYCRSLTSVTIGDGVTSIGMYTFSNCSSLESIAIPDSVTSIGSSAFQDCRALTNVIIPDSITSIDAFTFQDCRALTSINIPDGVTRIGKKAFYNCSLTSVIIGDGVTSIGKQAFYGTELNHVLYKGTEEAWNAITIDINNDELTAAIRHYNCTGNEIVDGVCTICNPSDSCANGHTYESVVTAPTCVQGGYTTFTCSVCGDSYVGDETEPTGAHTYVDGVCTVCGNTISSIYGDANGDGKVDGKDLMLLRKYMANYNFSTGESTVAVEAGADANGDGDVNGKDLMLLRKYMANYDFSTGESTVVLGPTG